MMMLKKIGFILMMVMSLSACGGETPQIESSAKEQCQADKLCKWFDFGEGVGACACR